MTEANHAQGRDYLFVTDFDQTLSFADSGLMLAEMLGIDGFAERVAGLAETRLVQQGANSPICCATIRTSAACAGMI